MIRSMNPKAWVAGAAIVAIFVGVLSWLNGLDVKDETARMAKLSQQHITVSVR
jgi:hypothetical protein